MTVKEFIKWLKTQDQGATVEVLCIEKSLGYLGPTYQRVDFDPEIHSDYLDMRGNKFAIGKPYENARSLFLGRD